MITDLQLEKRCEDLVAQAWNEGIESLGTGSFVLRDGQLLIVIRNSNDGLYGGCAEVPGGGIDEGETLLEGLARELQEETGLKISRVIRMLQNFDYIGSSKKRVRQFNALVEVQPGEVTLNPEEHTSYFWLDPHNPTELDTVKISPAMKELVLNVCRDLAVS